MPHELLAASDPPPVWIVNPDGRSSFLLIGDHAGSHIPEQLGKLGLGEHDLTRHIALDIGIRALGEALAESLDAPFIQQSYSRLVVDCNRARDARDAIAAISDGTAVPGNLSLDDTAREARYREIYEPYHAAIEQELERRDTADVTTVLVALHSFTPVMGGFARPWDIGILHDRGETGFAQACLSALRSRADLVVGDNEPYRMDAIDYTVPRHAYPAHRPYVEIEVRQDLLSDAAGVRRFTAIVASMLTSSAAA